MLTQMRFGKCNLGGPSKPRDLVRSSGGMQPRGNSSQAGTLLQTGTLPFPSEDSDGLVQVK